MGYTIAQVAEKTGLTAYTLRYYDKEGLLPFVDRSPAGSRDFKESDFEWLSVIICLKKSGMSVKEIKKYIDLCLEGDSTLGKRLELFREHKKSLEEKMIELHRHMDKINHKISSYEKAIEEGTEISHNNKFSSKY